MLENRILVIDDEKNITLVIQAILQKQGWDVVACNDSSRALQLLENESFQIVLTDLYMPGAGGMEILEECKKNYPQIPVILMTAFGTIDTAVTALKQGAFDFITKPFDQKDLIQSIQKALQEHRSREQEPIPVLQTLPSDSTTPKDIWMIGESAAMTQIRHTLQKTAPTSSTVLVTGETGTGKKLLAQVIHHMSKRADKPFIKINCAAIPADLMENELFGVERGAFTGAAYSKPGRFELAHEGTLFLDEVADIPLETQAKLLQILQKCEFERVGGIASIRVDVRIIASSKRDLVQEVQTGRFREDLFHCLNVIPIHLPPLREREKDIGLLTQKLIQKLSQTLKKPVSGIDPFCIQAFQNYSWPGNIRQLENILERMILMSDSDVLGPGDLPEEISNQLSVPTPLTFKEEVRRKTQQIERELIEQALQQTAGNITHTAESLGLSRKGLQLKIKELGIRSCR